MMYCIEGKKVIVPIFTTLLLISGVILSAPYSVFAQPANTTAAGQGSMITQDQAIQIAIANQSVQISDVKETELDDENDRTVYKVEIVKGNQELDVMVDALTGEVVKVEPD